MNKIDADFCEKIIQDYIELYTEKGNESLEQKAYAVGLLKGFKDYALKQMAL